MSKKPIPQNYERFATEYVKTGNQSEAYRIVYPASRKWKPDSVHSKASTLLSDVRVKERVLQLREKAANKAMMTKSDVLNEAMRIARFDIRKLYQADGSPIPIQDLDDETAAAVQAVDIHEEFEGTGKGRVFVGYTKKYKIADKNAALEKLFRHFGLYEADNSQKADPLRDFLNQCSGKSLPVVREDD